MCRELACHSLEGRRIDLITLTSWEGITESRETRLPCLFPDTAMQRCHIFENKKVIVSVEDLQGKSIREGKEGWGGDMLEENPSILSLSFQVVFVSSRVHPGETFSTASFSSSCDPMT